MNLGEASKLQSSYPTECSFSLPFRQPEPGRAPPSAPAAPHHAAPDGPQADPALSTGASPNPGPLQQLQHSEYGRSVGLSPALGPEPPTPSLPLHFPCRPNSSSLPVTLCSSWLITDGMPLLALWCYSNCNNNRGFAEPSLSPRHCPVPLIPP